MRILCVATKLPWPPRDGGRLALALTLRGLAHAGHEIRLIAPASGDETAYDEGVEQISVQRVDVPRISWSAAALRALHSRRSLSVARHHHIEMERAVGDALAHWHPDVLHAEQLQALANCAPALRAGVPVVLRMQNVESQLWRQTAAMRSLAWPLAFEADRLQAEERQAVAIAAHTITLSENDAVALRELCPSAMVSRIDSLPPAFSQRLPAGRRVEGEPAIVLSGSAGWRPNYQAARWFLREVSQRIRERLPRAVVHVFGGDAIASAQNLRWHPAPVDSIDAFPEDAIAAVPLFVGSGIRMRILEAWARGLPVVATSKAANGLDIVRGRELSIADTPDEFCAELCALAASADARSTRIDAGRAYLARRHDPVQATQALLDIYRQAIAREPAAAR